VKRVHLVSVEDGHPEDHLIILAEKDQLNILEAILSPEEYAFLTRTAELEIHNFFFPRAHGALALRILKPEKNEDQALEAARLSGNELLREIRQYKIDAVCIRNICKKNLTLAFAEGLALGSYQYVKHLSKPNPKEKPLREIKIEAAAASKADVEDLNGLLSAVFDTRDLVNEPFSHQSSTQFAESIEEMGRTYGFQVEIMGREKLESLKMGGLLSVSRASEVPPQFCTIEWVSDHPLNAKPIVLVGKGVVYDTGGLSLKPSEGMDYMKCDMAGAAAVVGVIAAAARNKMPLHLIGLLPITDNLVGNRAFSPGDVITMYSGKTVEVVNTDAEGRLILADALHYAKKYKPELVIDIATLTGAAVRVLGTQATTYMGTASKKIKRSLEDSGMATHERVWELPLFKEYGEELKSNVADLKNLGSANAGAITAGKFLENFIDYPWLHLDIAGPAYLRIANGYRTKEGTAVGVRLLYDFLKKYVR